MKKASVSQSFAICFISGARIVALVMSQRLS